MTVSSLSQTPVQLPDSVDQQIRDLEAQLKAYRLNKMLSAMKAHH